MSQVWQAVRSTAISFLCYAAGAARTINAPADLEITRRWCTVQGLWRIYWRLTDFQSSKSEIPAFFRFSLISSCGKETWTFPLKNMQELKIKFNFGIRIAIFVNDCVKTHITNTCLVIFSAYTMIIYIIIYFVTHTIYNLFSRRDL